MPSTPERGIILSMLGEEELFSSFFFSEIDDSAWLTVLISNGFYRELPEPVRHDDGSISHPRSHALQGLERLAAKAPEETVNIITELPPSKNVVVGDQIMRCMLAIREAVYVPQLLPVVEALISGRSRSSRLFLRDLLMGWIEIGCTDEALSLLAVFIDSIVCEGDKLHKDQQMIWELAECDTKILVPMVTSDPGRVADICYKCLSTYYDAADPHMDELSEVLSDVLDPADYDVRDDTYWLEDFRQVGLYRDDPRVILAHRLHAALLPIYQGEETARDKYDQELLNHPWKLFTRLRCKLYSEVPEKTLTLARRETLAALKWFNRIRSVHRFEFASMLESHSKLHGHEFLTKEEVEEFVRKVFEGPLNHEGQPDPDEKYQRHFRRQQLWPIRKLISDDLRQQLEIGVDSDSGERRNSGLENYKPIRSFGRAGFVKDISPFTLEELEGLSDDELWHKLNSWKRTKEWIDDEDFIQESNRELAVTFTELIVKQPNRFSSSSKWWQKIQRPVFLSIPLETWTKRLCANEEQDKTPPTEVDHELAFGIMDYIVSVSQDCAQQEGASEESTEKPDWWQARQATVRYLRAFIGRNPPQNQWSDLIKTLLQKLATGKDDRLDSLDQSEHHDWQFDAINSVRGETWDALIHLALKEKNHPKQAMGNVSSWIVELLTDRLNPEVSESPAIYSLLGSKLRILAYALPDWFRDNLKLLFPKDRIESLEAITDGHLAYDQPYKLIVEVAPEFLSIALNVAERRNMISQQENNDARDNARDVSSRLGFHIAFYFWNDWFPDQQFGKKLFDRFLSITPSCARAETLSYIGTAFEKTNPEPDVQPLIDRTQSLIDSWLDFVKRESASQTLESGELDAELGQFADLIAAECFSFDWRIEIASTALRLITRPRWSFQLLDTLEEWTKDSNVKPERISAGISLLAALTQELSDELRWSIQVKRLTPTLKAGLEHSDPDVRKQTNQVIENLLRHNFFELLDLVPENEK